MIVNIFFKFSFLNFLKKVLIYSLHSSTPTFLHIFVLKFTYKNNGRKAS